MGGISISIVTSLLVLLILPMCSILGTASESETYGFDQIGSPLYLEKGDHLDYEVDVTPMIQSMIEEEGSDSATYEDVSTSLETTIQGIETMTIDGKSVETHIEMIEMNVKFTIVDEEMGVMSTMDIHTQAKEWINRVTSRTVRSEETSTSIMVMTYGEGEYTSTSTIESQTITSKVYSAIDEADPFPLESGMKWSSEETYNLDVTEMSRYRYEDEEFSDWDIMDSSGTVIETFDNEVLPEKVISTANGDIKVIAIESRVTGSPDFEIKYFDMYGMVAQEETYQNEEPVLIITIREWDCKNLQDADGDEIIDILDDFPEDRSASVDSDKDGYPDFWNDGMTESDSSSNLRIDEYPNDATRWEKKEAPSDSSSPQIVLPILGLLISLFIVIAIVIYFVRRK